MFKQPVMIFSAIADQIKTVYKRALNRQLSFSVFTEDLFQTGNDLANRAAVKACQQEDLKLVGMAMRADKKVIDKVLDGLRLHS